MNCDPLARQEAAPSLFTSASASATSTVQTEIDEQWISDRSRAQRAGEELLSARHAIGRAVNQLQLIGVDPTELRRAFTPAMIIHQAQQLDRWISLIISNAQALQRVLPAGGGVR